MDAKLLAFSFVAALGAAACGGTTAGAPDSGQTPDSGAQPDDSAAPPDDTGTPDSGVPYPAPHPPPPQVISYGGGVAKTGKVVPVFWSNDSHQSNLETFLKALSPSTFWTATTKEYGVGDTTLGSSVVITDAAPSSIDDSDIQAWLAAHADGSDMAWPKADPNTVFVLYYPAGTTITGTGVGQSCQDFSGYHAEARLADNTAFSYAVVPVCGGGLDSLTMTTSHELVEWATDPLPFSNTAYESLDTAHAYWGPAGGEVADACEFGQSNYGRLVGNFAVQRSWSNAAIKAGHNWCVPAPAEVFFAAAPDVNKDPVKWTDGFGIVRLTRGVKVPVGMSKTIDVYLYSDAPKAPWNVTATTGYGSAGSLSFSFDKSTGQNGDVLHLTITSLKATSSGSVRFYVTSADSQNTRHTWYGLVGF